MVACAGFDLGVLAGVGECGDCRGGFLVLKGRVSMWDKLTAVRTRQSSGER